MTATRQRGKDDLEGTTDSNSKQETDSIYVTNNARGSALPAPANTKTQNHGDGDDEDGGKDLLHQTDPRLIVAQLIGVAILEFGIVLHSIIIGLTLAVDEGFQTLFVVLIFHREFLSLFPSCLSSPPPSPLFPYSFQVF